MPAPPPAYGRKPGPFVTAPDSRSKTAKDKAKADLAQKVVLDATVLTTIVS